MKFNSTNTEVIHTNWTNSAKPIPAKEILTTIHNSVIYSALFLRGLNNPYTFNMQIPSDDRDFEIIPYIKNGENFMAISYVDNESGDVVTEHFTMLGDKIK